MRARLFLFVAMLATAAAGCVEDSDPVRATPIAGDGDPRSDGEEAPGASPSAPSPAPAATCADRAAIDAAAAAVAPEAWDGRSRGRLNIYRNGAQAWFMEFAEPEPTPRAPIRTATYGSCRLEVYAMPIESSGEAVIAPAATVKVAGDLVLSSARTESLACGSFVQPAPDYPLPNDSSLLYEPGELLFVRAAGSPNGVPAFSHAVTAPPVLPSTTPVVAIQAPPVSVSRSSDTTLSWTTTGPGTVTIFAGGDDVPAGSTNPTWERHIIRCTADALAGGLTMSKDLFSGIVTDNGSGSSGSLTIETRSEATIAAGKFRIALSVATMGELQGTFKLVD